MFGLVAEAHGLEFAVSAAFGWIARRRCQRHPRGRLRHLVVDLTLGTLSVFRGIAKPRSKGETTRLKTFRWLGSVRCSACRCRSASSSSRGGLGVVMRATTFGCSVFAIGSSQQAARLRRDPYRRLFPPCSSSPFCSPLLPGCISVRSCGLPHRTRRPVWSSPSSPLSSRRGQPEWRARHILEGARVLIFGTLNNCLTILSISSFWQEIARGWR